MSALNTPEDYAFATTAVAVGGYISGSGVLNVSSTAAPFPQTQQFRIAILDVLTLDVKAILKVTTLTSSTAWGVMSDGLDANCNAGDIVSCDLTPDSMDQIRKDMSQFGTYASLPSTAGQKQGNRFKPTDSPFDFIYTGSIWQAYHRDLPCTPAGAVADYTGVNTGASWTAVDSGGVISFHAGGSQVRGLYKTQPSTPYKVSMFFNHAALLDNSSLVALGFYDGTKLMQAEMLFNLTNGIQLRVEKWNSVSSDNGTLGSSTLTGFVSGAPAGLYFRVGNTGSTLSFDWSMDGINWWSLGTEAVGTFITPTKVGFSGYSSSSRDVYASIYTQTVT